MDDRPGSARHHAERPLDGVLVIDKPQGLTSHDVVAAVRRVTRERRIGHTGTLDPLATGVLPLACGRATRLVRFLAAADKEYEARIRFGTVTDSFDVTGRVIDRTDRMPSREAVETAVGSLRGEYLQQPPVYSAKKVGGRRAYDQARRNEPVALDAVPVRVSRADLAALNGMTATVRLTCSSGFYVRSFAHTLGELTECGACLEALRRTRSGEFSVSVAIPLEDVCRDPSLATERLIPLEGLLSDIPAVVVTADGSRRVAHGQALDRTHIAHAEGSSARHEPSQEWVRLFDGAGRLLGLAKRGTGPGVLHPSVVLV